MDARTGKKIRLGRLFNQRSGRSLIVAYSHGLLLGPGPGLRSMAEMRARAATLAAADGLMVAPGMVGRLEEAFVGRERPGLVIQVDWQNFSRKLMPYREGVSVALASAEEALAAGADAVMTYMLLGHSEIGDEREEIRRNAELARACERVGLPLMIEPRSAREKERPADKTDPEIMAMYCRVAAELGADLVKCIYPESEAALAAIVDGCPAPLLVAGGPRRESLAAALEVARASMTVGAAGLVFGRNIYQADDPAHALGLFRALVHEEQPV